MAEQQCPNCTETVTEVREGCVLEAFLRIIVDRGYEPEDVLRFLPTVDLDEMWDEVAHTIDQLEHRLKEFLQKEGSNG